MCPVRSWNLPLPRTPSGRRGWPSALERQLGAHLEHSLGGNVVRRSPHHNLEVSRHHRPMHVAVEHLEIGRGNCKGDRPGFAGTEGDTLKAAQLFDRHGNGGHRLMDIELDGLRACAVSGVLHLDADLSITARCDRGWVDTEIAI